MFYIVSLKKKTNIFNKIYLQQEFTSELTRVNPNKYNINHKQNYKLTRIIQINHLDTNFVSSKIVLKE